MITVNNILRSVYRLQNKNDSPLNILTLCKHTEKYISLLCKTKHNFYIPQSHSWNHLAQQQPSNLNILESSIVPYLDYIICYDRAEQYEEAQTLASHFHVPIILVDMCSKSVLKPHHILENIKIIDHQRLQRQPALQICNTKYISESWGQQNVSTIIPVGIDTDIFKSQQNTNQILISIDNNTAPVVGSTLAYQIKGRYPILPVEHDNLEIVQVNRTQYYLNTNKSITISLLEAMAAANITISLKTEDTENFIVHNETGILLNSIHELSDTITFLETHPELKQKISQRAQQKILQEHSISNFVSKWLIAFKMIKALFYTPS